MLKFGTCQENLLFFHPDAVSSWLAKIIGCICMYDFRQSHKNRQKYIKVGKIACLTKTCVENSILSCAD